MIDRRWQRIVGVVAIAECAPMVFGCASTNRFVVDPDLATSLQVESVVAHTEVTTKFDGAGGRVDLAAMTVEGTSNSGEPVVMPLVEVRRFYFRDDAAAPEAIKVNPQSLLEGGEWRPDGRVHHVVLRSGEVLDLRKKPTTLDLGRRLLLCQPADGAATTIPFDQILYVQIRDDHPVRSSVTFFGSAILLALGEKHTCHELTRRRSEIQLDQERQLAVFRAGHAGLAQEFEAAGTVAVELR